jgi:hypothetical protein
MLIQTTDEHGRTRATDEHGKTRKWLPPAVLHRRSGVQEVFGFQNRSPVLLISCEKHALRSTKAAVSLCFGILLWVSAGVSLAHAQTVPPRGDAQEEAEHEKLRELGRLYERAIRDGRIEMLEPHLHPDFSGVMITNEPVTGFAGLKAYWHRINELMGEGGRYTTTMQPERSVIVGDVALARGTTADVVVTDENRRYEFNSHWTAILQKQGNEWKLLRVQGSIDPIGNPFVRDFTRRALIRAGAAAAIAGLAVGWLIAIFISRRRARTA